MTTDTHHFQLRIGDRFVAWLYGDAVSAVDLAVALRQSPTTAHYRLTLEGGEPLLDGAGVPLITIPGLPQPVGVPTHPSAEQAGDWVQQWLGQLQAHASQPPAPTSTHTPSPTFNPWGWWTA